MKSFLRFISQSVNEGNAYGHANNSSNLGYKSSPTNSTVSGSGMDFRMGQPILAANIRVSDWHGDEEMKPWQIRTADIAHDRYLDHIRWMKAVDDRNADTHPELPDWQLKKNEVAEKLKKRIGHHSK